MNKRKYSATNLALFLTVLLAFAFNASAQTTAFTFQGRLSDSTLAANGTYDVQFSLFDAASSGSQIGSTQTMPAVSVVNGIFTVTLDFGQNSFSGAERFLEVSVRRVGDPNPHTLLTPRQPVTSAPYAIRSLDADTAATATNSTQLGGIDANQYVQTNDSRLSDARDPNAGSANYIQNRTNQQPLANFNISGNGTIAGTLSGNVVSANSVTGNTISSGLQYNIGATRVFAINGTDNTFAGVNAGTVNTSGAGNSFFGRSSGQNNTTGGFNTFIGKSAGVNNTTGDNNTFIGRNAATSNTEGSNNTLIGAGANVGLGNPVTFATAIGAGALVFSSNTVVLGRTEDTVVAPGRFMISDPEAGGSLPLCRLGQFSAFVAYCSSSLRYKTNIEPFNTGLDLVNRLQPITFDWKKDGIHDLGLGAEDVEKIEPLLVTHNKNGQVEGVKYDRIGVVLLNAVKEQQAQIQRQQLLIEQLRKLVCQANALADVCKEDN